MGSTTATKVVKSLPLCKLLRELGDSVLEFPHLFVCQGFLFLTILQFLFNGFLSILGAQLCIRLNIDLVAEGVSHFLQLFLARRFILLIILGLTFDSKVTPLHNPSLSGNVLAEFLIVRNNQYTTLVVLDGKDQRAKPIAI